MADSFKPPELRRPRRDFAPEDPSVCPYCGGTGWVIAPDGGNGAARQCECRIKGRTDRLIRAAKIPDRYLDSTLENFKALHHEPGIENELRKALFTCRSYVDDFLLPSGKFVHWGLIFIGPAGAGKTHLATAVTLALIQRYKVRARFVEFTDLISRIQATFDRSSSETRHGILEDLLGVELLVIDELGVRTANDWQRGVLYELVNGRYAAKAPTLFTTNFSLEERAGSGDGEENLDRGADQGLLPRRKGLEPLSSRLPVNLISRLHEMARPVELFSATDYRREVGRNRINV